MTLINRIMAKIKSGDSVVYIREKDVSKLAQRYYYLSHKTEAKEDIERQIRNHGLSLMGALVMVDTFDEAK